MIGPTVAERSSLEAAGTASQARGRFPCAAWTRPQAIVLALIVGYIAQVGFRLQLAEWRNGPLVLADEIGYLAHARLLAGGVPGELTQAMFYRGGYSLFLVPAYLVGDDPVASYHRVLGINALLSSATFPLIYLLLRHVFRASPPRSLAAAFVAAAYPPLVLNSLLAWSESLLTLLFVTLLVALAGMVQPVGRARWVWAAVAGSCSGLMVTAHGRGVVLVLLLLGTTAIVATLRPQSRGPALLAATFAVFVYEAGAWLNSWLMEGATRRRVDTGLGQVLSHMTDPGILGNIVNLGFGQYWYLSVASFGLFGFGLIFLIAHLRRGLVLALTSYERGRYGRLGVPDDRQVLLSAVAVLAVLGLGLLAALFLYPPTRPDIVVYGRYVELTAPPVIAVGLLRLWQPRRWCSRALEGGLVLGATLVAFIVIRSVGRGLLQEPISNSYTTLALPALAGSITRLHPGRVTAIALIGGLALLLLARRGRAVGVACVLGVFVWSAADTRHTLFEATARSIYGPGYTDRIALPTTGPGVVDVGYDVSEYTVEGLWTYQWQLPRARFVIFDGTRQQPPAGVRYVISGKGWQDAGPRQAHVVWLDPLRDQAVYQLPDPASGLSADLSKDER